MPAEFVRNYLVQGLLATPIVMEQLLRTATEADFDRRPDPERFTIREVVAHLAEWDGIWLDRFHKVAAEDNPHLPTIDEGELAIQHDYVHSNLREQLAKFQQQRQTLAHHVAGLAPEDWDRTGRRSWGEFSVTELVATILGHDGYHTRQVSEWLNA